MLPPSSLGALPFLILIEVFFFGTELLIIDFHYLSLAYSVPCVMNPPIIQ
jgi:hypothetical protein